MWGIFCLEELSGLQDSPCVMELVGGWLVGQLVGWLVLHNCRCQTSKGKESVCTELPSRPHYVEPSTIKYNSELFLFII